MQTNITAAWYAKTTPDERNVIAAHNASKRTVQLIRKRCLQRARRAKLRENAT